MSTVGKYASPRLTADQIAKLLGRWATSEVHRLMRANGVESKYKGYPKDAALAVVDQIRKEERG